MAEASLPNATRPAHKPLEYTSCIDATVSSSTTVSSCGNINSHSSFDFISEPRACDTLVNSQERSHRMLERDLRRIDIDTNKYMIEMPHHQLDRTGSVSLPSTPIEHLSAKFHPSTMLTQAAKNRLDNDDDLDDDGDEGEDHFPFNSSVDYMNATAEAMPDKSTSQSKSTLQSDSSSSSSSPPSETNIPFPYGVDWSDRACSTSHCWFAYIPTDPASSPACSFFSCKNPKPALLLSLVQCESCFTVVHSYHLSDQSTVKSNSIPACRPSFFDEDEQDKFDQHFWSNVPVLSKPCVLCKRKSMSNPIFGGNNRPSTMPTLDIMTKGIVYTKSPIPDSARASSLAGCLQCSWCARGYHRRCWEQVFNHADRNKCDYGIFRHIIVRPQWIRRLPGYTPLFRAQRPSTDDRETSYTPLLLFINKRSGGQSGEKIYRKLLHLLNPRQVFLLENDQTIIKALDIYSSLSNIRICVFGGDGTVGWILGRLSEIYPSLTNPPVCICPLGTGNDLSRVLSWGEQYDPKRMLPTLIQIPRAQAIALDRWQVTVEPFDSSSSNANQNNTGRTFLSFITHPKFIRDTTRPSYQTHQTPPNTRFINYMSFGLDAAIALEFHHRRTRNPRKFSSPLKNKLIYLNESCKYLNDFARSRMWNLSSYIRLICDGEDLTDSIKNCHTLLVLNIPGYASGTNPWGKTSSNSSSSPPVSIQKDSDSFEQISTSSVELTDLPANAHDIYEMISLNECSTDQASASSMTTTTSNLSSRFERQDFGDRKIEVVGLSTTHMATIHIGFRGIRIAQCSQLRIESGGPMTAQMDGEPFYIPQSAAFNITHAGQVLVLRNDNR